MNGNTVKLVAFAFLLTASAPASLEDILKPLPVVAQQLPKLSALAPALEKGEEALDDSQPQVQQMRERESIDAGQRDAEVPVKIEKPLYPINEDDLLSSIEREIHTQLRPAGRVSLAPMRRLPDLSSHSQPFSVRLSRLPGRLSKNTLYVTIQVENDEGVLGNWDIPFRAHLYSDVWFAKAHLRKGDLASVSDFEVRQVDLLMEPDAVVAKLEVLQRHEYSRDIRPGHPLEWTDLAERSLVRKGQVVDVIAYQGMIGISMRAKAQQDGLKGDMVFLRNLESNKDFTGEVIGEGRVQVSF